MFPQKVTISNDTANSQIMPGLVVCVFFFSLYGSMNWEVKILSSHMERKTDVCSQTTTAS